MRMIKSALLAGALLTASAAHAVVIIDFTEIGDANEYGAASLFYSYAGFDLTVTGTNGSAAFAYLDKGHAGLGVCGALDSNNQCNPSSDDNVTVNEILTFSFSNLDPGTIINIDNLWVNNTHDPNPSGNISGGDTVLINGNSTVAPGNGYATGNVHNNNAALNASAANAFSNYTGNVFTIGYGGDVPEQFYVSGIEISVFDVPNETVPVPGSLLLLGAGLLGLRFARRGGKKHA